MRYLLYFVLMAAVQGGIAQNKPTISHDARIHLKRPDTFTAETNPQLVWDDATGSLPLTCKHDGTGTGWICKIALPAKARFDAYCIGDNCISPNGIYTRPAKPSNVSSDKTVYKHCGTGCDVYEGGEVAYRAVCSAGPMMDGNWDTRDKRCHYSPDGKTLSQLEATAPASQPLVEKAFQAGSRVVVSNVSKNGCNEEGFKWGGEGFINGIYGACQKITPIYTCPKRPGYFVFLLPDESTGEKMCVMLPK